MSTTTPPYDGTATTAGDSEPSAQADTSDQIITIKHAETGRGYKIRKSLLVEKSGYFRAMFSHNFIETTTGIVTLHDDDPKALGDLLWGLQRGKKTFWPIAPEVIDPDFYEKARSWVTEMARVWVLADKYDIPSITTDLAQAFADTVNYDAVMLSYDPFLYGQTELLGLWLFQYQEMTTAMHGRYPAKLYPLMADLFIRGSEEGFNDAPLKDILKENHELALYVTGHLVKELVEARKQARERW